MVTVRRSAPRSPGRWSVVRGRVLLVGVLVGLASRPASRGQPARHAVVGVRVVGRDRPGHTTTRTRTRAAPRSCPGLPCRADDTHRYPRSAATIARPTPVLPEWAPRSCHRRSAPSPRPPRPSAARCVLDRSARVEVFDLGQHGGAGDAPGHRPQPDQRGVPTSPLNESWTAWCDAIQR